MRQSWLLVLWIVAILFGGLLLVLGFVDLIDPSGAKLADDGDPFGTPTSRLWSGLVFLAGASLAAIGVRGLWLGLMRRRHPSQA